MTGAIQYNIFFVYLFELELENIYFSTKQIQTRDSLTDYITELFMLGDMYKGVEHTVCIRATHGYYSAWTGTMPMKCCDKLGVLRCPIVRSCKVSKVVRVFQFLWNLACILATLLPRHMQISKQYKHFHTRSHALRVLTIRCLRRYSIGPQALKLQDTCHLPVRMRYP